MVWQHTVQACGACDVDHPTKLLFAEDWPGSLGTREGTFDMNGHDRVPFFIFHVFETNIQFGVRVMSSKYFVCSPLVPQDTGIVDKDGNTTIGIDSSLDDCSAVCCR